nr:CAP domain-containing protein [Eubacteriales bacterium]
MKRIISLLLSVVMLTGVLSVAGMSASAGSTVSVQYNQSKAREMLAMINNFRTSGTWCWNESNSKKVAYPAVKKLVYDYNLEKTAMLRAAEISVKFDHTRPNGSKYFTAFSCFRTAGENIALTTDNNPQTVFELWREDNEKYKGQGHRRNMLGKDFGAVGIACAYINGRYYWVQEFRDVVVDATPTSVDDGVVNVVADGTGKIDTSNVVVKAPKITYIKSTAKGKLKFKWNSQANVSKYQIQYSYSKSFKKAKTKTLSYKTGAVTIKKLKSKKKVYVRVRAKNKATGKYTKWSKVKYVKIK